MTSVGDHEANFSTCKRLAEVRGMLFQLHATALRSPSQHEAAAAAPMTGRRTVRLHSMQANETLIVCVCQLGMRASTGHMPVRATAPSAQHALLVLACTEAGALEECWSALAMGMAARFDGCKRMGGMCRTLRAPALRCCSCLSASPSSAPRSQRWGAAACAGGQGHTHACMVFAQAGSRRCESGRRSRCVGLPCSASRLRPL